MKNFEAFQNALQNDAAMKAAVQAALAAADEKDALAVLKKVAADNGYDISDAKISVQPAESGELVDSSMSSITGGSSNLTLTFMTCRKCGYFTLWSGDFGGKSFDCRECGGKGTLFGI